MITSLGDSGLPVVLAAPALGAGREVEHALPGEVLDLASAEGCVLVELVDVLEVDRLAGCHHRQQRTESVRLALGQHVDRRHEDVQVLGVDDQHQEAEDDPDLGENADGLQGVVGVLA
jgi:hypothetical protein